MAEQNTKCVNCRTQCRNCNTYENMGDESTLVGHDSVVVKKTTIERWIDHSFSDDDRFEMFRLINFAPRSTYLPIARINIHRLSDLAIQKNYGGLRGHYLFLTTRLLRRHKAQHQRVGTGFIASKNCLFRELNRGVDWVFSNHAGKLQLLVDTLLQKHRV